MGDPVKYKVETGTREMYDMVTGSVISSNKYTVKKLCMVEILKIF